MARKIDGGGSSAVRTESSHDGGAQGQSRPQGGRRRCARRRPWPGGRRRLLPFLDADVEFANERISENGVFAALNREEAAGANILFASINPVSLRYEFDFWGKNRAALEAALGEAEERGRAGGSPSAVDHCYRPSLLPRRGA